MTVIDTKHKKKEQEEEDVRVAFVRPCYTRRALCLTSRTFFSSFFSTSQWLFGRRTPIIKIKVLYVFQESDEKKENFLLIGETFLFALDRNVISSLRNAPITVENLQYNFFSFFCHNKGWAQDHFERNIITTTTFSARLEPLQLLSLLTVMSRRVRKKICGLWQLWGTDFEQMGDSIFVIMSLWHFIGADYK